MSPEPGAVYRVDLGITGKVRFFVVVSRRDDDPPRALALCVPITTQNRGSEYEVELPRVRFLREQSYANVQGIPAIQFHELQGPVGCRFGRKSTSAAATPANTNNAGKHDCHF